MSTATVGELNPLVGFNQRSKIVSEQAKQFEDLRIWQEARQLVVKLYSDFKIGPGAHDFGFKDQIQRAGISIVNNIAEGFERETDNDFAKFLDYAYASFALSF